MSNLRVVTQSPVLFTGTDGGGSNEFAFTNLPNGPNTVTVPINGMRPSETVIGAWYSPLDNISDLTQFATIQVSPNGREVNISAHGYENSAARVRVTLYAMLAEA